MSYEKLENITVFDKKHKQQFTTFLRCGLHNNHEYSVVYLKAVSPNFYLQVMQYQKSTFMDLVNRGSLILSR